MSNDPVVEETEVPDVSNTDIDGSFVDGDQWAKRDEAAWDEAESAPGDELGTPPEDPVA